MSVPRGTRYGPYEILSLLGVGGMGEVYRARDTRLQRDVAVKILPPSLVPSQERRQRFEREARLVAQISHPGICALFDVGSEGDTAYLVMELLEGETLAARLARGPLPLEQVVRHGTEIASALGAAHDQGIVHRDLKPANVMLTKSGVKLLDFGLAKALATERSSAQTQLPTEADDRTASGAILGTLQYMSPEQLEGRPADARADVFALGTVLFEMATGRKAFNGSSQTALVSAILTSEPPSVSSVQPNSPPALDRLVATCLAKDPTVRWRSAHDVGLQLRSALEPPSSSASGRPATASPPRRPAWLPWLVAGIAATVAVIASITSIAGRRGRGTVPEPARTIRFTVAAPAKGRFSYWVENSFLAISPDGSRIAYIASDAGGRRVWIRPVSELEPHPLPGTEGASSPFFSPDGRSIAFFSGGSLKRIDLAGGSAIPICDVAPSGGKAGTWGAGDEILFGGVAMDAIVRVSAAGGTPVPIVKVDRARGETRALFPRFLPDGKRFLYSLLLRDATGILMASELASEPGGTPRAVMPLRSQVDYVEPGVLVFVREGTLLGQRFDWQTGSVTGAPFSIADRVRYFHSTASAAFAVSRTGTVAYQAQDDVRRLVWFDRDGRELGTVGAPGGYLTVSISPSGRRLLTDRTQPQLGSYDVYVMDLERGTETRLTSRPESEFGGLWLPGETSIVYSAARGGVPQLFRLDLATGKETALLPERRFQQAQDVSPDGGSVIYTERSETGRSELWSIPVTGEGSPHAILRTTFDTGGAHVSPDGRLVAYVADETGRDELYVAPYPGPGERIRVSTEGAWSARWRRDGREVLYRAADGRLMSVPVRSTVPADLGVPVPLFRPPGRSWIGFDVTPDGKRILAIEPQLVADELPLTVVVNGAAEPAR